MAMFGVLLDVSGSMEKAYALDRSHTVDVERTHAIFTTVANIVKREVYHHDRQESIFVSAFGLEHQATCDLPSLLDIFDLDSSGHLKLIRLAEQHGAPYARKWIVKYLSNSESHFLYDALRHNEEWTMKLLKLIPDPNRSSTVSALQENSGPFFYDLLKGIKTDIAMGFVK